MVLTQFCHNGFCCPAVALPPSEGHEEYSTVRGQCPSVDTRSLGELQVDLVPLGEHLVEQVSQVHLASRTPHCREFVGRRSCKDPA